MSDASLRRRPAGEVAAQLLREQTERVRDAQAALRGSGREDRLGELCTRADRLRVALRLLRPHFERGDVARAIAAARSFSTRLARAQETGRSEGEGETLRAELRPAQRALELAIDALLERAARADPAARRGISLIPFGYFAWTSLRAQAARLRGQLARADAQGERPSPGVSASRRVLVRCARIRHLITPLQAAVEAVPRALELLDTLELALAAPTGAVSVAPADPLLDALDRVASELFEPRDDTPVEIERRFVLSARPQLPAGASTLELEQGWLPVRGNARERLRRTRRDGAWSHVRTLKLGSGLARFEWEAPMSADEFERLWPQTAGCRVRKTRYRVPCGDLTWEVDVYPDLGFCAAEVELPSVHTAVELPQWLAPYVEAEVTEDPRFTSLQLALRGVPERGTPERDTPERGTPERGAGGSLV